VVRAVTIGAAVGALLGICIPLVLLYIDATTRGGWWPPWIMYVWPTDFMLGVASGERDRFFVEIAAVATAINAALYAAVGAGLGAVSRLFLVAGRH
jgi:hypothetical protein